MDLFSLHQFIDPITDYLRAYPHTGYLITLFVAFIESLAIIGSIIPGSILMTAIGVLIGSGVLPLIPTFICAIIGSFIGDFLSYLIGKHYNERLLHIWPIRDHPEWLTVGEKFFKKHGGKSVVLGRFFGPIRSAIPLVAGMMRMNTTRFIMATIPAVILWAILYTTPGILVGAFALELPESIATKFILLILGIVAFGWLVFVLIHMFFKRLLKALDISMQKVWLYMTASERWVGVTRLVSYPDQIRPHKQLTRVFYIFLCMSMFMALFLSVYFQNSIVLVINHALFFFFRSLRNIFTDPVLIAFTLLAEKAVLLSASVLIAIWLAWRRALKAALIYIGVVVLSAGSIGVMKYVYDSPRPSGLLHGPTTSSFPSGHTILAVACFGFLAFLIAERAKPIWRKIIYLIAITLVSLVAFSRLYLGAHWLTDVLAAIVLGLAFVLLGILFYYRRPTKIHVSALWLSIVSISVLVALTCGYGFTHYREAKRDYTLYWPLTVLEENKWWETSIQNADIPLFVVSRLGNVKKILNVQWIGNLDQMTHTLTKQGWAVYPVGTLDLKKTLQKFSNIEESIHLPLWPIRFQDKLPVRIFTYVDKQHRQITLILWESRIQLEENMQPFWVGSLFYYVPNNVLKEMPSGDVEALYDDAIHVLAASLDNVYKSKIYHLPPEQQPSSMRGMHWDGDILLIRE